MGKAPKSTEMTGAVEIAHLIPIEESAAPIREDRGKLIGVVLVVRDVTHERKSQEMLRKSEKLAGAARLLNT